MEAFKPKGARPEWLMIYDEILAKVEYGDVITLLQINEVLGRDFTKHRGPLYRAMNRMGEERKRWLESVPGIGYRVIEANENMRVAGNHKRRAKRQLGRMLRVADSTDVARLSKDELAKFDTQSRINAALFMVAVHHEKRIARIEQILMEENRL